MVSVGNKVSFRFLGKVIEGVVLDTYYDEAWKKDCHRLQITSGEHIGSDIVVPVDFTFTNVKDAYSLLHIGNKVKYVSGYEVFSGVVIGVDEDSACYYIKDLDKPSEIFYINSAAFDLNRRKDGYFWDKSIEEMKGA